MEEEIKKIVVDLDANTQEFDKKMQDSLARLREFEEELPRFGNLLKSLGNGFKSFGGEIFDWTNLIDNSGREAIVAVEKVFGDIKKLQIKGFEDLGALYDKVGSIILKHLSPALTEGITSTFSQAQEEINQEFEKMGINIITGAANLQKRLESIKIEFNPLHVGKDDKQNKLIDEFFKNLELSFFVHTQNFKAFDGLKQPIADGIKNALDLGIPLNESLSKTQSTLSNFWNTYPYVFESTMLTAKVKEKIDASIKKGLSADEALAKAAEDSKKSVEYWTPFFTSSYKFLADTLALGVEQIFINKDIKVDFGIQFRKILGSFMSSLGDTLIQQATKMLLAQAAITKVMTLLGTPPAWLAITGLFALGAALKGGGAAMSKTADNQLSGKISVNGLAPGNNGMMTSAQNMAPSYAMQTQSSSQSSNESVLRGGDVFWSGQRYEVIRGF